MNNNLRNFISIMLVMLLCSIPVFGASAYTEGFFEYQIEDDSVTITDYFGKESEVTVPNMIAGNPVSKIAKGAFYNKEVKTVNLPDTIMEIANGAFSVDVNVIYDSNTSEPIASGGNTDDIENIRDEERMSGNATSDKVNGQETGNDTNISSGSASGSIAEVEITDLFEEENNHEENKSGENIENLQKKTEVTTIPEEKKEYDKGEDIPDVREEKDEENTLEPETVEDEKKDTSVKEDVDNTTLSVGIAVVIVILIGIFLYTKKRKKNQ